LKVYNTEYRNACAAVARWSGLVEAGEAHVADARLETAK
jgi:hypothetical protein